VSGGCGILLGTHDCESVAEAVGFVRNGKVVGVVCIVDDMGRKTLVAVVELFGCFFLFQRVRRALRVRWIGDLRI